MAKDHPAGSTIRPSIWPTAVLLEGNDLAFDIQSGGVAQRWLRSHSLTLLKWRVRELLKLNG